MLPLVARHENVADHGRRRDVAARVAPDHGDRVSPAVRLPALTLGADCERPAVAGHDAIADGLPVALPVVRLIRRVIPGGATSRALTPAPNSPGAP